MWRSIEGGQICHDCYEQNGNNLKGELEPDNENSNGNGEEKKLRKSTRSTRYKAKNSAPAKPIPKGRSRRYIFKKTPFKAPVVPATTHTVESTFYKVSSALFEGLKTQMKSFLVLCSRDLTCKWEISFRSWTRRITFTTLRSAVCSWTRIARSQHSLPG